MKQLMHKNKKIAVVALFLLATIGSFMPALSQMKIFIQLSVTLLYFLFFSNCTNNSIQMKIPNVIFFLVDDLGWSDVGCNGSKFYETPNIDKLANEGVRFTNAYSACHVCSPTRASILTGKYPASLNLTDWLPGRRNLPFQKLKNVEIN